MVFLYILLGIGIILLGLIAVILVRTLLFSPKPQPKAETDEIKVHPYEISDRLRELVRCKTVSYTDPALEDDAEFEKLISLLPKLFPHVYKSTTVAKFEGRGLLFRLKGEASDSPSVFMAHYDVVPVSEVPGDWEKPPFEAVMENGKIYGRGTLDTKVTFASSLYALDMLIESGFTPKQDIYLAYSGSEEVNGKGASSIVDYFERQGICPAFVLDEGGAVVEGVFPGVSAPCALIGIAEKGMINLEYSVKSGGGHASSPKPHTPVGTLSLACAAVEAKPFKSHLTPPVAEMFDTLGRHSGFLYRMIFANLWAFGWVIDLICKKSGGELNALMRTTVAFTQMEGSSAPNVIPPSAKMVSNLRLNPMDDVESAVEYIKGVIDNPEVELRVLGSFNPSRISVTNTEGYSRIASAIVSTWRGSIVSPYLMMQCSDSRHWGRISDRVYRFSAMDLTKEERGTIHGNNEAIRLDCLQRATEFYIRLMRGC